MSQLPWGGKPDSPVDDPNNTTGPGQGADPGPAAEGTACDCACPDYGERPWLPPGGGPGDGPGGDPDYTGTYYQLRRCRDDALVPAWVQSNEFSPDDVLLIEQATIQFCYYVDSVEVAAGTVQLTNVVRPNDVTETYDDCPTCRAVSDPEIDPGPIPPTSFAQLAFCKDDTLAPLWTPVEIFGLPVAEDLTKIYEIDNVCYYVSNNIQDTPGGPLMPVFAASIYDDCFTCADVCTKWAALTPNNLTVTGITDGGSSPDCSGMNGAYVFDNFDSDANYCQLEWVKSSVGSGDHQLRLFYKKTTGTADPSTCTPALAIARGEMYAILRRLDGAPFTFFEGKVTGVILADADGAPSGGFTLTTACFNDCDGPATITFT